jgi:hypothetical protein
MLARRLIDQGHMSSLDTGAVLEAPSTMRPKEAVRI